MTGKVHKGVLFTRDQIDGKKQDALIRDWQDFLNTQGFALATDGKSSKELKSAIRAFQKISGLSSDGVIGPRTWKARQRVEIVPEPRAKPANLNAPIGAVERKPVSDITPPDALVKFLSGADYSGQPQLPPLPQAQPQPQMPPPSLSRSMTPPPFAGPPAPYLPSAEPETPDMRTLGANSPFADPSVQQLSPTPNFDSASDLGDTPKLSLADWLTVLSAAQYPKSGHGEEPTSMEKKASKLDLKSLLSNPDKFSGNAFTDPADMPVADSRKSLAELVKALMRKKARVHGADEAPPALSGLGLGF